MIKPSKKPDFVPQMFRAIPQAKKKKKKKKIQVALIYCILKSILFQ